MRQQRQELVLAPVGFRQLFRAPALRNVTGDGRGTHDLAGALMRSPRQPAGREQVGSTARPGPPDRGAR
ncbi:MAG TPA: hypothetical protein VKA46_42285 [Gemmataceae bacterium]|nr:hypothetical protein [Gemmataceae bacterium]